MSDALDIFIGGQWRKGRGDVKSSINPANGDEVARFSTASPEDVDEAAEAGAAAMKAPEWREMKPHDRAKLLRRISDGLAEQNEEIAQLQTSDTGKCLSETRALAASASATFQYFAAALETLEDALTPPRGDYLTMSIHEPMGVVGAITPWNSPIASDAQKVAPALAAGNAVLLKPAEWTSLVSRAFARICEQAGLPKGLLSVLPGDGPVVGDQIVRHPLIKKVSFTGGTVTGRSIAKIAAEKLIPVSLELGGKSPTVVFDDAEIDHAVNGVALGVFSSTGQSCIAGSRLFVQRGVLDKFVAALLTKTRDLKMGDPTDPQTRIAPMVSFEHRQGVADYVELARAEGGEILSGGQAPDGEAFSRGAFYAPTIISGLTNDARTCQEEIFGPVLVLIPFDDEDDLVAMANDSVYGLACGLWTRDYRRAWRVARRIEAGTVWINTYKQFSISTPFGGVKESGLGREKGREGIRAYMNQKSLYWGLNEAPLPWAN
ncbi:MAG: aldehyde dehydrogenase [Pseudomonadota bacterium]